GRMTTARGKSRAALTNEEWLELVDAILTGREVAGVPAEMPSSMRAADELIENMLAASMSPSMAASLDWSRALQSRSIVP
ncbi:MAG: conjugal transfer protein TraH, partial [Alphaproteobacteria bacterium]|nr:conjugal transfer protein TraH [Alphaproteobacteria bacterium]